MFACMNIPISGIVLHAQEDEELQRYAKLLSKKSINIAMYHILIQCVPN